VDFLTVFTTLVTCLTPIAVAWGGWKVSLSQKQSKEYHELLEKYNKERAIAEEEKEKAMLVREERLEKKINDLEKKVNDLLNSSESSDLDERVDKLYDLTEINHDYIQTVSSVVTSIGEGLISSDVLSGEMKQSVHDTITKHRETEKDLEQRVYKAFKVRY